MAKRGYQIMGKVGTSAAELLDHADSKATADYLVREYKVAYGKDWRIWWRRGKDER